MRFLIPLVLFLFTAAPGQVERPVAPSPGTRPAQGRGASPEQRRGASSVPSPASVFGFEPGADYKLATYDQSVAYFKKLAAASRYIEAVRSREDEPGAARCTTRSSRRRRTSRSSISYREIARRLAHPQGLTDDAGRTRSRTRARRSCTSTAACTPRRSPARSTRRCWPTTCVRTGDDPGDQGHARQRRPDAVADDQSRRPADGGRVVHEERRHAVRAVGRCRGCTRSTSATTTTATPTC